MTKFNDMQTQLQAISLRIQAVRSNDQMARSMRDATGLLASMNRSMNLPQLQRISMEFEKQSDLMDQRQEMMDEAIDNAMEDDEINEDEEAEEIVNKVLDEIGVSLNMELGKTPVGALSTADTVQDEETNLKVKQAVAEGPSDPDSELQARLDSLKRR